MLAHYTLKEQLETGRIWTSDNGTDATIRKVGDEYVMHSTPTGTHRLSAYTDDQRVLAHWAEFQRNALLAELKA